MEYISCSCGLEIIKKRYQLHLKSDLHNNKELRDNIVGKNRKPDSKILCRKCMKKMIIARFEKHFKSHFKIIEYIKCHLCFKDFDNNGLSSHILYKHSTKLYNEYINEKNMCKMQTE